MIDLRKYNLVGKQRFLDCETNEVATKICSHEKHPFEVINICILEFDFSNPEKGFKTLLNTKMRPKTINKDVLKYLGYS